MSIYDVIADKIKDGEVFELTHSLGFQIVRRTIVSKELYGFIRNGPWELPAVKARGFALYSDLDHFMAGMEINVALPRKEKPYERKDAAFLRLLHRWAEEVWELRSYSGEPSLRVFGRFVARDYFAALTWESRANLGNPPWRGARLACKTVWTRLFHPYPPLSGADLHDYLSTNAFRI
jgi:hypothetical protein